MRVTIATAAGNPGRHPRASLRAVLYHEEPGSGTGLGLHISHRVVARHGGRIDVDSAPGDTRFTVSLPPPTLPS